jgi:hypothetical protein
VSRTGFSSRLYPRPLARHAALEGRVPLGNAAFRKSLARGLIEGVRSKSTSARMRSSFATVGFRRPSTSGRATSARAGVTSSIQRAESYGVRSGTSTRRGKRPLIRPTRLIMSA